MPRVIITTLADADTAEILADLFNRAGQVIADKFNARFETMYDRLAEYPDSGALRPGLGRHIRIGTSLCRSL